jgi:hypothetical protein
VRHSRCRLSLKPVRRQITKAGDLRRSACRRRRVEQRGALLGTLCPPKPIPANATTCASQAQATAGAAGKGTSARPVTAGATGPRCDRRQRRGAEPAQQRMVARLPQRRSDRGAGCPAGRTCSGPESGEARNSAGRGRPVPWASLPGSRSRCCRRARRTSRCDRRPYSPSTTASARANSCGDISSPEAAAFSSSCSGRLAPTIAEATLGSRKIQASEN